MSQRVRVRVPIETTVIRGPTGDEVAVKVDAVGRYADLLEEDAARILFSGLPESVPWRELNPDLVGRLKPPPRPRAVSAADMQHAADMALPINPFDRASIARQTLAMLRSGR